MDGHESFQREESQPIESQQPPAWRTDTAVLLPTLSIATFTECFIYDSCQLTAIKSLYKNSAPTRTSVNCAKHTYHVHSEEEQYGTCRNILASNLNNLITTSMDNAV